MRGRKILGDFNQCPFFFAGPNLLLADLKDDVLFPVVRNRASVSERINKVFGAEVIWIGEAAAEACNADSTAFWVFTFSIFRSQGFMSNSLFRLGTG